MSKSALYYELESALDSRSVIQEGTEGLEEFKLSQHDDDPYIQALYLKYGVFDTVVCVP